MQDLTVETRKVGRYTINIVLDHYPEHPSGIQDIFGHVATFARGRVESNWGDYPEYISPDLRRTIVSLREARASVVILFDQSGGRQVKTWHEMDKDGDESADAVFFCFSDDIRKEYGTNRTRMDGDSFTPRQMAVHFGLSVLDTLKAYWDGNVYGYEVCDEIGDVVESCYGYYGGWERNDSKTYGGALAEGLRTAEYLEECAVSGESFAEKFMQC